MGKVFYVCSYHCIASDINKAVEFMANQIYNELRITNKDDIVITTALSSNNLIVIGTDKYGNVRKRKAYRIRYKEACSNMSFVNIDNFEFHPELEYKKYDNSKYENDDEKYFDDDEIIVEDEENDHYDEDDNEYDDDDEEEYGNYDE